jgi:N-acetylglucosamine kinase-like BadF-type ATPase
MSPLEKPEALLSRDRALFLCVDCGGTKTAVAIANKHGEVIARATGGPSNFAYLGLTNFMKTVQRAVEDALKQVHPVHVEDWKLPTKIPVFRAAWLGISGVDSPANVALLTPPLAELFSLPPDHHLTICNDTHLLAAPLHSYPHVQHAVCVIGGTGSIAASFRRGQDGKMLEDLARVGGWGWILGDEGGGFDVGRTSVRMILREYEEAVLRGDDHPLESVKQSWLVREVLALFGVDEPAELLSVVHDPDPEATEDVKAVVEMNKEETPLVQENGDVKMLKLHPHRLIAREKRLSQLAPLVFTAAFTHHDPFALRILTTTAQSLASQASLLLRHPTPLTTPNQNAKIVPASNSILCFGGSLVGVAAYRELVVTALSKKGHVFQGVEFVGDAARAGVEGIVRHFG